MFGDFLQKKADEHNLTQTQIARKLGVTNKVINFWFLSDYFPSEERLAEIARVFSVDLDELLKFWEISKIARNEEKNSRKPPARRPVPVNCEVFPVLGISGRRSGKHGRNR